MIIIIIINSRLESMTTLLQRYNVLLLLLHTLPPPLTTLLLSVTPSGTQFLPLGGFFVPISLVTHSNIQFTLIHVVNNQPITSISGVSSLNLRSPFLA